MGLVPRKALQGPTWIQSEGRWVSWNLTRSWYSLLSSEEERDVKESAVYKLPPKVYEKCKIWSHHLPSPQGQFSKKVLYLLLALDWLRAVECLLLSVDGSCVTKSRLTLLTAGQANELETRF